MHSKKMIGIMLISAICLLLWFASAPAEEVECENATYDLITGMLTIPVVDIDGELFSAELEKQGNSLNFNLVGFGSLGDEADGSDCELATYDQSIGIIHIPSLEVADSIYSVDLVRRGNSETFELDESTVTFIDNISGEGDCAPASYDVTTGVLHVPIIKVDGAFYTANMERRGNSANFELIFVDDFSGEIDETTCEIVATFDAVTGVLYLPLIKIGTDYYTAELQMQGSSQNIYFDVTAVESVDVQT